MDQFTNQISHLNLYFLEIIFPVKTRWFFFHNDPHTWYRPDYYFRNFILSELDFRCLTPLSVRYSVDKWIGRAEYPCENTLSFRFDCMKYTQSNSIQHIMCCVFVLFFFVLCTLQGRIHGWGGGAPGARPPPLKFEKIRFFSVKSWFFTRNTPKIFAPPSAIGKNTIFLS
jgi:hypothetical protein